MPHTFSATSLRRSIVDDARAELLELVREGSTDLSRAGELVDILLDSKLPFREAQLGGGPFEVVYSRGALLWQGFTAAGNALSKRRVARSANRVSVLLSCSVLLLWLKLLYDYMHLHAGLPGLRSSH